MSFMYRKHLPHLLSTRPESESGENSASNSASMFSIYISRKQSFQEEYKSSKESIGYENII